MIQSLSQKSKFSIQSYLITKILYFSNLQTDQLELNVPGNLRALKCCAKMLQVRSHLLALHPENFHTLEKIEECILVMGLDDDSPSNADDVSILSQFQMFSVPFSLYMITLLFKVKVYIFLSCLPYFEKFRGFSFGWWESNHLPQMQASSFWHGKSKLKVVFNYF